MQKPALRVALVSLLASLVAAARFTPSPHLPQSAQRSRSFGVYVNLFEASDGGFDEAVAALRRGIGATGWQLVAEYDVGVDRKDCAHRGHVFVLHSPAYARAVLAHGVTAAFALPLRLAVYEDERGVHVAAANPQSLNRTIVAETGFEMQSDSALATLRQIVATAFPGQRAERQYGQIRERGLISKTMGLMAGGPFLSKIETAATVDLKGEETLAAVAQRLYRGLERLGGTRKWQMRPVYMLDLSDEGVVIIGMAGAAMEARAMHIVGEGNDPTRKALACPGLDHAPAFPIELVLSRNGRRVTVAMIDAMFRMKMYFEDAGNMKFAVNMTMPGSIGDEIKDEVEETLH